MACSASCREHAPLITTLQPGELRVKRGGEETSLLVTGGFMEVTPEKVLVLADAAERSEEIDLARAEEARRRAEERLAGSRDAGGCRARGGGAAARDGAHPHRPAPASGGRAPDRD